VGHPRNIPAATGLEFRRQIPAIDSTQKQKRLDEALLFFPIIFTEIPKEGAFGRFLEIIELFINWPHFVIHLKLLQIHRIGQTPAGS
jgi:hypothetical protein